ncbi:hypothetical protein [Streptomyces candidus]|uniref:C2H2-type domain-containing protein n=1 Tax=Streptomyces candidus TaxID=67283 RepID=A0A7X0LNG5_9ACTN|nr:hypothetical protein [Streptomyces candidus]GHH47437.1 hypothetical protein GCM10018773_40070 [Streptomyces candidus]
MSDIAQSAAGSITARQTSGNSSTTQEPVEEAYAFACMKCGHGWEQAYAIEHHTDGAGHPFVVYRANGERVPSPLSRPSCLNCGGTVVRIMRSGQVSTIQQVQERDRQAAGPVAGDADEPKREPHHWHLSDLLHPFHRR